MGRVSIYAHPEDGPHASSAFANYGLVGVMLAWISSVLVATIGGACILYISVAAQENVDGETAHTPALRIKNICAPSMSRRLARTRSPGERARRGRNFPAQSGLDEVR